MYRPREGPKDSRKFSMSEFARELVAPHMFQLFVVCLGELRKGKLCMVSFGELIGVSDGQQRGIRGVSEGYQRVSRSRRRPCLRSPRRMRRRRQQRT